MVELIEAIIYSFYKFYHKGSNKVDMLRHKGTSNFEAWGKKEYLKLAKDNPVKFLLKTHGDFFKVNDGSVMALQDDLEQFIHNEDFKNHIKDAIELRVETYYKNRFLSNT